MPKLHEICDCLRIEIKEKRNKDIDEEIITTVKNEADLSCAFRKFINYILQSKLITIDEIVMCLNNKYAEISFLPFRSNYCSKFLLELIPNHQPDYFIRYKNIENWKETDLGQILHKCVRHWKYSHDGINVMYELLKIIGEQIFLSHLKEVLPIKLYAEIEKYLLEKIEENKTSDDEIEQLSQTLMATPISNEEVNKTPSTINDEIDELSQKLKSTPLSNEEPSPVSSPFKRQMSSYEIKSPEKKKQKIKEQINLSSSPSSLEPKVELFDHPESTGSESNRNKRKSMSPSIIESPERKKASIAGLNWNKKSVDDGEKDIKKAKINPKSRINEKKVLPEASKPQVKSSLVNQKYLRHSHAVKSAISSSSSKHGSTAAQSSHQRIIDRNVDEKNKPSTSGLNLNRKPADDNKKSVSVAKVDQKSKIDKPALLPNSTKNQVKAYHHNQNYSSYSEALKMGVSSKKHGSATAATTTTANTNTLELSQQRMIDKITKEYRKVKTTGLNLSKMPVDGNKTDTLKANVDPKTKTDEKKVLSKATKPQEKSSLSSKTYFGISQKATTSGLHLNKKKDGGGGGGDQKSDAKSQLNTKNTIDEEIVLAKEKKNQIKSWSSNSSKHCDKKVDESQQLPTSSPPPPPPPPPLPPSTSVTGKGVGESTEEKRCQWCQKSDHIRKSSKLCLKYVPPKKKPTDAEKVKKIKAKREKEEKKGTIKIGLLTLINKQMKKLKKPKGWFRLSEDEKRTQGKYLQKRREEEAAKHSSTENNQLKNALFEVIDHQVQLISSMMIFGSHFYEYLIAHPSITILFKNEEIEINVGKLFYENDIQPNIHYIFNRTKEKFKYLDEEKRIEKMIKAAETNKKKEIAKEKEKTAAMSEEDLAKYKEEKRKKEEAKAAKDEVKPTNSVNTDILNIGIGELWRKYLAKINEQKEQFIRNENIDEATTPVLPTPPFGNFDYCCNVFKANIESYFTNQQNNIKMYGKRHLKKLFYHLTMRKILKEEEKKLKKNKKSKKQIHKECKINSNDVLNILFSDDEQKFDKIEFEVFHSMRRDEKLNFNNGELYCSSWKYIGLLLKIQTWFAENQIKSFNTIPIINKGLLHCHYNNTSFRDLIKCVNNKLNIKEKRMTTLNNKEENLEFWCRYLNLKNILTKKQLENFSFFFSTNSVDCSIVIDKVKDDDKTDQNNIGNEKSRQKNIYQKKTRFTKREENIQTKDNETSTNTKKEEPPRNILDHPDLSNNEFAVKIGVDPGIRMVGVIYRQVKNQTGNTNESIEMISNGKYNKFCRTEIRKILLRKKTNNLQWRLAKLTNCTKEEEKMLNKIRGLDVEPNNVVADDEESVVVDDKKSVVVEKKKKIIKIPEENEKKIALQKRLKRKELNKRRYSSLFSEIREEKKVAKENRKKKAEAKRLKRIKDKQTVIDKGEEEDKEEELEGEDEDEVDDFELDKEDLIVKNTGNDDDDVDNVALFKNLNLSNVNDFDRIADYRIYEFLLSQPTLSKRGVVRLRKWSSYIDQQRGVNHLCDIILHKIPIIREKVRIRKRKKTGKEVSIRKKKIEMYSDMRDMNGHERTLIAYGNFTNRSGLKGGPKAPLLKIRNKLIEKSKIKIVKNQKYKNVVVTNEYNTSALCNKCNEKMLTPVAKKKLKLQGKDNSYNRNHRAVKDRYLHCTKCKIVYHRDINGARNILDVCQVRCGLKSLESMANYNNFVRKIEEVESKEENAVN